LEEFAADFEAHGVEAIKIVRCEDPSAYLKICAALVPQAFDETTPLQVAVQQISRVIIDSPEDLAKSPIPIAVPVAARPVEIAKPEEVKSPLTKLLESSEQ